MDRSNHYETAFEAYLLQVSEFSSADYVSVKPLADATLAWQCMPLVVPQLKTITAAGAGCKAALAVERYLSERGLLPELVLEVGAPAQGGACVARHGDQGYRRSAACLAGAHRHRHGRLADIGAAAGRQHALGFGYVEIEIRDMFDVLEGQTFGLNLCGFHQTYAGEIGRAHV